MIIDLATHRKRIQDALQTHKANAQKAQQKAAARSKAEQKKAARLREQLQEIGAEPDDVLDAMDLPALEQLRAELVEAHGRWW